MLRRAIFMMVAAFLFSTAAAPTDAMAEGKIGVVNPMRLSNESDPGKEAEKQLNNQFGKERQTLEKQRADLDKQAEEFRKQAPAMSDKARADKLQKIQKDAQELDTKGTAYTQRLTSVQQAINTQINDVLREACDKFAKDNKYDLILDGTVVMFYTKANDCTDGLISEVNKIWKSKGGKFNLKNVK